MTSEQLNAFTLLSPLLSPLTIAFFGWWLKSQLKKIDEISNVLMEIGYIKEKLLELKINQEKMESTREDFIVAKSEMKSQWKKIDDLTRVIEKGF